MPSQDPDDSLEGGSQRGVKTTVTVFELVQTLQNTGGLSVTQLATEMEMAKSTIHDHLSTLSRLGYVHVEEGIYKVGLRFLDHGIYARDQIPISSVAHQPIEQLAQDTEEVVLVVTEQNGRAVFLDKVEGRRAVPVYARIGTRSHLHCLASGKAMLAHFPRDRVEEIVTQHGLPKVEANTITRAEELFERLDEIRARGYALNDNEAVLGTRAVGAAVVVGDVVHGAISVAGPANRLNGQKLEDIIDSVLSTSNELELKLAH